MKQVFYIDASSLRNLKCPERFLNTTYYGLRIPGRKAYKPTFGIAYHKYKADRLSGADHFTALGSALRFYKDTSDPPATGAWTMNKLEETCSVDERYQETYTVYKDAQGKALVEQKFSLPLYSDDDLEIYLSGTIDFLAERGGQACFGDHKVTESWKVEEFLGKYMMDHQMMVYHKVLDYLATTYPNTFGIFQGCPFFIRMIQVAAGKTTEIFTSELLPVCEAKVEKVDGMLEYAAELIVNEFHKNPVGSMRYNFAECSTYGMCPFHILCNSSNEEERTWEMNNNYVKKAYDPLQFDKE